MGTAGTPVLVFSGATATGTMAIQLLKRQVLDIITSSLDKVTQLTGHTKAPASTPSHLLTCQQRPLRVLWRRCSLRIPPAHLRHRHPHLHQR